MPRLLQRVARSRTSLALGLPSTGKPTRGCAVGKQQSDVAAPRASSRDVQWREARRAPRSAVPDVALLLTHLQQHLHSS